jgi:hypothetical protein
VEDNPLDVFIDYESCIIEDEPEEKKAYANFLCGMPSFWSLLKSMPAHWSI